MRIKFITVFVFTFFSSILPSQAQDEPWERLNLACTYLAGSLSNLKLAVTSGPDGAEKWLKFAELNRSENLDALETLGGTKLESAIKSIGKTPRELFDLTLACAPVGNCPPELESQLDLASFNMSSACHADVMTLKRD